MSERQGQQAGTQPYNENSEIARQSARQSGGMMAIVVSALALVFSAVSLYQTVIKQAQLHVYLPDTINYTRDPDGSFEVFVLPITVSNSGAPRRTRLCFEAGGAQFGHGNNKDATRQLLHLPGLLLHQGRHLQQPAPAQGAVRATLCRRPRKRIQDGLVLPPRV